MYIFNPLVLQCLVKNIQKHTETKGQTELSLLGLFLDLISRILVIAGA